MLKTPAIANYTTGEVMGVSSDGLSAKFSVSRKDQDLFTVRSYTSAAKAIYFSLTSLASVV